MGVPSFQPPVELVEASPYWDAISVGQLKLPACASCQKVWWYPLADTPCHPGSGLIWRDVPQEGTVYTFSTVHRDFLPGEADAAPYMVGLVEPDGLEGTRIVALLVDVHDGDGVIGTRVRFAPVESPAGYMVPAFEPITR